MRRKSIARKLATLTLFALGVTATLAAQAGADRVAIPLTDPARPVMLKANVLNGGITVKAYEGKEVIVEARVRHQQSGGSESGRRRIPINSTGLAAEEEDNRVHVSVDALNRTVDLTIQVPVKTSVNLHVVNDGDIEVTGIEGEIEVDNVNGEVTLQNIAGSVVAHALNGKLLASFRAVNPAKPMAFSSLNGDIDVTFPADLKATVSMSSDQGEVFSDFDIQLQPRAVQPIVEDGRTRGGRYRVRVDKNVRGTINGGGQEIQFKNFQGNTYIRKAGVK